MDKNSKVLNKALESNEVIVLQGVMLRPEKMESKTKHGEFYHTFTISCAKQLGEDITSVVKNYFHVIVPTGHYVDSNELLKLKNQLVNVSLSPKCSTKVLSEGYTVNNITFYLVDIAAAKK